jgi:rubrerythrin
MEEYDFYKALAARMLRKDISEITVEERKHVKLSLLREMYSGIQNNSVVTSTIIPELLRD